MYVKLWQNGEANAKGKNAKMQKGESDGGESERKQLAA